MLTFHILNVYCDNTQINQLKYTFKCVNCDVSQLLYVLSYLCCSKQNELLALLDETYSSSTATEYRRVCEENSGEKRDTNPKSMRLHPSRI